MACGWEFVLEDKEAESLLDELDLWGVECHGYIQALVDGETAAPPEVDYERVTDVTRQLISRLEQLVD